MLWKAIDAAPSNATRKVLTDRLKSVDEGHK